jgi:hypothetical protein
MYKQLAKLLFDKNYKELNKDEKYIICSIEIFIYHIQHYKYHRFDFNKFDSLAKVEKEIEIEIENEIIYLKKDAVKQYLLNLIYRYRNIPLLISKINEKGIVIDNPDELRNYILSIECEDEDE